MTQHPSLSETLQNLSANGYHITDLEMMTMPEETILSHDWRLDAVHHVKAEKERGPLAVVIAVSSVHKHMKLAIVRELISKQDFSPLALLKRLFPQTKKSGVHTN